MSEVVEDFVELLQALRAEGCEFLVVGGHALAAHGSPRATGDIDIFVRPTAENAERIVKALVSFGAPLHAHGVTATDFATPGMVYQMGLPPRRIDILTEISGVTFDEASKDRVHALFGDCEVSFIGLDAMIVNKRKRTLEGPRRRRDAGGHSRTSLASVALRVSLEQHSRSHPLKSAPHALLARL